MKRLLTRVAMMTLALVVLMAGGVTAQDTGSFGAVSGTIGYRPRIALPDGARVVVELAEVGAPAVVIAAQTLVANGRQVPLAFRLTYDAASIQPNDSYAVRARIEVDGALVWISETSYPVITNGVFEANINLTQVPPSAERESPVFDGVLTGTIRYPDRIALPDDARVEINLADKEKIDSVDFTLASQRFATAGRQVPIPFTLSYDAAGLKPDGQYILYARIYVGGRLTWTTFVLDPLNAGAPLDIMLEPAGG